MDSAHRRQISSGSTCEPSGPDSSSQVDLSLDLRQYWGTKVNVEEQIEEYLAHQPELKRSEMRALHDLALRVSPACRLWFNDGMNSEGKVIANPNIGYGFYTLRYADGTSREFYRVGLSANKTGISVYILGLEDKTYLAKTFGNTIGKASVTGYCIKFKTIKNIDVDVLQAAIRYGLEALNGKERVSG